jgi:pyrroloquinoline quinone biosynthesis protein D
MAIHEHSRPKLAAKARLRFDRREQRFMLLFPERGLLLNDTAIEILQCCTGQCTIEMIVDILSAKHPGLPYESISNDVVTFISRLQLRGLIKG